MAAYNFQKRYVPLIEQGVKRSTIRKRRKNGYLPRPGDVLSLYQGMRTKYCKLIRKVAVESVEPVVMTIGRNAIGAPVMDVAVRGARLAGGELDALARQEGFHMKASLNQGTSQ